SASLETDELAEIISYEEYHPFGTSSWQAGRSAAEVKLKRYRYTGMEHDEESGFNYHSARYYAPWLGRWTATDPKGLIDGVNIYCYVSNNPVVYTDKSGMSPDDTPWKRWGRILVVLWQFGLSRPTGEGNTGRVGNKPAQPQTEQHAEDLTKIK